MINKYLGNRISWGDCCKCLGSRVGLIK